MKIIKLGHCALILEINGIKILTDPGNFTAEAQEAVTGLDAILITHEHQDHFHAESVQKIVANNTDAIVITNAAVGKLLKGMGIIFTQVGDEESAQVKGINIEGFGSEHAIIYGDMGNAENTGYMINGQFYFPGDNFHAPGKEVDVLALPVAGPWMKMAEAIDFAKAVKPRVAFGVHDAMVQPFFRGFVGMLLQRFVPEVEYVALQDGESGEF